MEDGRIIDDEDLDFDEFIGAAGEGEMGKDVMSLKLRDAAAYADKHGYTPKEKGRLFMNILRRARDSGYTVYMTLPKKE